MFTREERISRNAAERSRSSVDAAANGFGRSQRALFRRHFAAPSLKYLGTDYLGHREFQVSKPAASECVSQRRPPLGKAFPIPAASELGPTRQPSLSTIARIKLNAAPLMPLFVLPPIPLPLPPLVPCPATLPPSSRLLPPTPDVSRPPTLLSRPKLIGLRIGRSELFILCPAINQFLRRPNRGRKDRAATRAAKRRTSFGVRVLEQREGRREGRRANQKAARERGTRWQLSLGKLVNLAERSSGDVLRHVI
jgi:hypothetical protein